MIQFGNKKITKTAPIKKVKGDIEAESKAELKEVSEYSLKAKAERARFEENTDANYFTVITFNNSKQLDEFLNKIGITPSDKQYINGLALAKKLGIEIETPSKEAPGAFRASEKLKDLVL